MCAQVGKRFVTGIGGGSPARRAADAAAASTSEESLPPEKLTKHGPGSSAGRQTRSSALKGVSPGGGAGSGAGGSEPGPRTMPVASSGDTPFTALERVCLPALEPGPCS